MENASPRTLITAVVIVVLLLAAAVVVIELWSIDNTSVTPTKPTSTAPNIPSTDTKSNTDSEPNPDISKAQVEKTAVDKYGGVVRETELDTYKGQPVWEVDLRDSIYGRIEVEIDRQTGEILHYGQD